ncbi:MAG: Transcriptional regulator, AraC family [Ferruginibacter sp.]|nr:Transcriptional regulator, AraC family [Ferruginibacter sp.]
MLKNKYSVPEKRQGFEGQRIIILPGIIVNILAKHPITKQVFITGIGYFPKARNHYVERIPGIGEHILIYCTEGSGWIETDGKKIDIDPSQLIIIPANTPHKYGSSENEPWTIYWFHFSGEISGNIVNLIIQKTSKSQPNIGFSENRIKIFEEIFVNLERGYIMDNLLHVNMTFYHFLSSAIYEEKFNFNNSNTEKNRIDLLLDYVQNNLGIAFKLEDLALHTNLSISQFSSLFKSRTGYSPIEYVNHLKIQKACQQLLLTEYPAKQIGFNVGIEDPYYFSRLFSKVMGISPGNYRRKNKVVN